MASSLQNLWYFMQVQVYQSPCHLLVNLLPSVGCLDSDSKFITCYAFQVLKINLHKFGDDITLVGLLIHMGLCWDHWLSKGHKCVSAQKTIYNYKNVRSCPFTSIGMEHILAGKTVTFSKPRHDWICIKLRVKSLSKMRFHRNQSLHSAETDGPFCHMCFPLRIDVWMS